MLSEHAKEIIKDIDNVRKKRINIDCLLQKYHDEPERDFIQKYAEIEIASSSNKKTTIAFLFSLLTAIVAIMLTVGLFYFPEDYKKDPYPEVFLIGFYVYFIFFIYITYAYIRELFFTRKDVFKEIITEIEDINMQTKSTIISKLDIIISKIEAINPRIDVLEKNVSTKIEAINKEIMSLKKK